MIKEGVDCRAVLGLAEILMKKKYSITWCCCC